LDIVDGSIKNIKENSYNTAIGYNLAINLNIWLNDTIPVIIIPNKNSIMNFTPKVIYLKVKLIFNINNAYNNTQLLLDQNDLKKSFNMEIDTNNINIKIFDPMKVNKVSKDMNVILNKKYKIKTWVDDYQNIFETIKMEKSVINILIISIIFLFTLNLISNLFSIVINKKFDIAILRIMGLSKTNIMITFILKGIVLCAFGTCLGLINGILISFNISKLFHFFQNYIHIIFGRNTYYKGMIPYDIQKQDIIYIYMLSILSSLISTIYPILKIYYMNPIKILKNE